MNAAILTMVHKLETPFKLRVWTEVLSHLADQSAPVYLFADRETPEYLLNWVRQTYPQFHIDADSPLAEWPKCRYAYQQIPADYIAICHQDDFWVGGKIMEQLKWIHDSPLVTTAYLQCDYNDWGQIRTLWKYPYKHSEYGLIDCMPSTWMINKKIVKEIPNPFSSRICTDLGIAIAINQLGSIQVIKMPYVIYHDHLQNGWNTLPKEEIEEGRNQLKAYAKSVSYNINLNYHTGESR